MTDITNFLQHQRSHYDAGELTRANLSIDPVEQFKAWFNDAIAANAMEANAMNIATVNDSGQPSNRIVLLKGVDENGFVFFTNYKSRKAKEIQNHPLAAITFFWPEVHRQVRIEGSLKKVSEKESDEYFKSRPRQSQLGALASAQSEVIESRDILEQRLAGLEKQYPGDNIPRPAHWGGYVLTPNRVEFWQGRPNRLHDRFQYSLQKDRSWQIDRLSP